MTVPAGRTRPDPTDSAPRLRRVYRTPARVGEGGCRRRGRALRRGPEGPRNLADGRREARAELSAGLRRRVPIRPRDRQSVVTGKSLSGRVDIGGRRIITKKKKH